MLHIFFRSYPLIVTGRGVNEPSRARTYPSSARARLIVCWLELKLGSFRAQFQSSYSARRKNKKLELGSGSARLVCHASLNELRLDSSSFMVFGLV